MSPLELRRGPGGVVRVAHRGGAALALENSLEAIEASAALGVDAVEIDVLRRDDGSLVLAHGPEIPPTAPLLDDALDCIRRLGIAVQVDVKAGGNEPAIVAALGRHDLLARAFVSSFSPPILRAFATAAPHLPRSLTFPEDRLGATGRPLLRPAVGPGLAVLRALAPLRLPSRLHRVGARAATLNAAVASPAAIGACHGAGAAVYVWTVNEAALATTLVARGIDGIITDDPRLLASRL